MHKVTLLKQGRRVQYVHVRHWLSVFETARLYVDPSPSEQLR